MSESLKQRLSKAITADPDFRDECLDVLMAEQTSEERQKGTSLHRNRCGFNKEHAAKMKRRSELDDYTLDDIAIAYVGQLACKVEEGELELPEVSTEDEEDSFVVSDTHVSYQRPPKRPRRVQVVESSVDMPSGAPAQPEWNPKVGLVLLGGLACPSHEFRELAFFVFGNVKDTAQPSSCVDVPEVQRRVAEVVPVSAWDVEIALYLTLPRVHVREGSFVRLLEQDGTFATQRVVAVRSSWAFVERVTDGSKSAFVMSERMYYDVSV